MKDWKDTIIICMFMLGLFLLFRGLIGIAYAEEGTPENRLPERLLLQTQSVCYPYEEGKALIEGEYDEVVIAEGTYVTQTVQGPLSGKLEFFANRNNMQFTLYLSNGVIGCILGVGQDFQPVIPGTEM